MTQRQTSWSTYIEIVFNTHTDSVHCTIEDQNYFVQTGKVKSRLLTTIISNRFKNIFKDGEPSKNRNTDILTFQLKAWMDGSNSKSQIFIRNATESSIFNHFAKILLKQIQLKQYIRHKNSNIRKLNLKLQNNDHKRKQTSKLLPIISPLTKERPRTDFLPC